MKVEFIFTPNRRSGTTDTIEVDDSTFDNMSDEQRNDYLQEMALDWACDFYDVGFRITDE